MSPEQQRAALVKRAGKLVETMRYIDQGDCVGSPLVVLNLIEQAVASIEALALAAPPPASLPAEPARDWLRGTPSAHFPEGEPARDEPLRVAVETFVCAYRDKYTTGRGVRSNSPMRDEVAALNAVLVASGTGLAPQPPEPPPLPAGAVQDERAIADIAAERKRQQDVEGWTPEHDDEHSNGDLARAAAWFTLTAAGQMHSHPGTSLFLLEHARDRVWPWRGGDKPKHHRENLVKAGALIVAEIERLDRAALANPHY